MTAFRTPIDIANRALQHCGATRINPTLGFNENSKNAAEVGFCYDKLREAELQRRYWTFAIRRQVLRAIDGNTMLLVPSIWMLATTYFVGSIVADGAGNLWISNSPNNLGNEPLTTPSWDPYFGPMAVPLYDTSGTTAYASGELVYTTPGNGTNRVYLSLQDGNSDNPATATPWSATTTYFKNQVVTYLGTPYMSLVDLNLNQTPSSSPTMWTTSFVGGAGSVKWLEIGGTEFPAGVSLTTLNIVYPLGAGPSNQVLNKNAFMLPAGYMRMAPQNPKPGTAWLGGPSGVNYNDWTIEGRFLISWQTGIITLRFVANVTDVTKMHAMFCEGLATRIGLEVCEPLTQSSTKLGTIGKLYDRWMTEAGIVDAIEDGYSDDPDDEYIAVRI